MDIGESKVEVEKSILMRAMDGCFDLDMVYLDDLSLCKWSSFSGKRLQLSVNKYHFPPI